MREAIGVAVHEAIVQRLDQIPGRPYSPERYCWLYAAVGKEVATEFAGTGYEIDAGQVDFLTAGGALALEGAGHPIAHHAWVIRRIEETTVEVVDLAARHYSFWFAES